MVPGRGRPALPVRREETRKLLEETEASGCRARAQWRGGLPRSGENPSSACVLEVGRRVSRWMWRQSLSPARVRCAGANQGAAAVGGDSLRVGKAALQLGNVYTAAAPPEAGETKHDATAVSMMAVLRYGSGVPWNRTEGLQANFGIPLPAATQCEILTANAVPLQPALEELKRQAAQAEVVPQRQYFHARTVAGSGCGYFPGADRSVHQRTGMDCPTAPDCAVLHGVQARR